MSNKKIAVIAIVVVAVLFVSVIIFASKRDIDKSQSNESQPSVETVFQTESSQPSESKRTETVNNPLETLVLGTTSPNTEYIPQTQAVTQNTRQKELEISTANANLSIDGKEILLPITLKDLETYGYSIEAYKGKTLKYNRSDNPALTKDGDKNDYIVTVIQNKNYEDTAYADCVVNEININLQKTKSTFTVAGLGDLQELTDEKIIDVLGEPTGVSEFENSKYLSYSTSDDGGKYFGFDFLDGKLVAFFYRDYSE